MFKSIMCVIAVLFSSQLLAEKVYKWVDEKGQIHYSSQKPVDQETETIKLKKAPKISPEATPEADDQTSETVEGSEETESDDDAAAKAEAKAKLAKADIVNNKKQCDRARKNYNALNATVRVSRTNEKGESVRLNDDERVKAMQTAQQAIKQYCQ